MNHKLKISVTNNSILFISFIFSNSLFFQCLASLSSVYMIDRHFQARHPKSKMRFLKKEQNIDVVQLLSDSEVTPQPNDPGVLPNSSENRRLSPLKEMNTSSTQCLKLTPLPPTPKRPARFGTNSNPILVLSTPASVTSGNEKVQLPPLAPIKPTGLTTCTASVASTSTLATRQSIPRNNNPNTPLRVLISDKSKDRVVRVNSSRSTNATKETISTRNSDKNGSSENSTGNEAIHGRPKPFEQNSKDKNNIWTRLNRIKEAIVSGTFSRDSTTEMQNGAGTDGQSRKHKNRKAKRNRNHSKNNSQATSCENNKDQSSENKGVIQDNTVESSSQNARFWKGNSGKVI